MLQSKTRLKKFIPFIISGIIFVFGRYVLELFPEKSNPLQGLVPIFLQFNSMLINTLNLGTATVKDNILFLSGDHGPFTLQVFWPSLAIHLIITYAAIILVFLFAMNITRKRKITYLVLGIIGTIGANMIRIFILSLFALKVTTNIQSFEAFHGKLEYMTFLPWLVIYLIVIYKIELSRKQKMQLPT